MEGCVGQDQGQAAQRLAAGAGPFKSVHAQSTLPQWSVPSWSLILAHAWASLQCQFPNFELPFSLTADMPLQRLPAPAVLRIDSWDSERMLTELCSNEGHFWSNWVLPGTAGQGMAPSDD